MRQIIERDAEVTTIGANLCTSLLGMLKTKEFQKNLGEEMTKEYDEYISTIENHRTQLEKRHCTIVVAGGYLFINNYRSRTCKCLFHINMKCLWDASIQGSVSL